MTYDRFETVHVAGQLVNAAGQEHLRDAMVQNCLAPEGLRSVPDFNTNGQSVLSYTRSEDYRTAVEAADIAHADIEFVVRVFDVEYHFS